MKRYLIIFCILLSLSACNSDKKLWDEAQKNNTKESYTAYISQKPDGKFVSDANKKIDSIVEVIKQDSTDWQKASKENSLISYNEYLNIHAAGLFKDDAKIAIERLEKIAQNDADAWKTATTENTFFSYKNYIDTGYKLHLEEAEKSAKKKFKELINKNYPEINDFFKTAQFIKQQQNKADSILFYFSKVKCNFMSYEILGGVNKTSLRVSEYQDLSYAFSLIESFYKFYKINDFYKYEIINDDAVSQVYFTFDYYDSGITYLFEIRFQKEDGIMKVIEYSASIDEPGC